MIRLMRLEDVVQQVILFIRAINGLKISSLLKDLRDTMNVFTNITKSTTVTIFTYFCDRFCMLLERRILCRLCSPFTLANICNNGLCTRIVVLHIVATTSQLLNIIYL